MKAFRRTLDFCFLAELPQNVCAGTHANLRRE
jgi:hypothetical protein